MADELFARLGDPGLTLSEAIEIRDELRAVGEAAHFAYARTAYEAMCRLVEAMERVK